MTTRSSSPFSQLNTSTAKMQYSFPKGIRFESPAKNISDVYYNLPSMIGSGRKAGIGVGRRSEMGADANSQGPSPTKYNLRSMFNAKSLHGTKFRYGREDMQQGGIFTKSTNPGPASYEIPTKIIEHPPITMKPRLKDISLRHSTNPGPGAYDLPEFINSEGKYTLSQLRNSSVPFLTQHKSVCLKKKIQWPGPGSYDTKQNLSPDGTYFNAKFHSTQTRTFGKVQRKLFDEGSSKLGPGSYNIYSEFD